MRTSKEELIQISMDMILSAGDAKTDIHKALEEITGGSFDEAFQLLESAHEKIKCAHSFQTKTIQKEAKGEEFTYSILFSHAQDTLMTVFSEYNLTLKIVKLMQMYDEKLKKVEEDINEITKRLP